MTARAERIRVFLFKREYFDAFHLRVAIGMSFGGCIVDVLDQSEAGMRTACAIARSDDRVPGLILVEQVRRDPRTVMKLDRIRGLPELRPLPVVILGDGEEPDSVLRAYQAGADGFIPLPEHAIALPRIGRDLEQFWWEHRTARLSGT